MSCCRADQTFAASRSARRYAVYRGSGLGRDHCARSLVLRRPVLFCGLRTVAVTHKMTAQQGFGREPVPAEFPLAGDPALQQPPPHRAVADVWVVHQDAQITRNRFCPPENLAGIRVGSRAGAVEPLR